MLLKPVVHSKDLFTWSVDMVNDKFEECGYNMIIGSDLLFFLGMIIDFKYSVIRCSENDIPMNKTKLAIIDRKGDNKIFQLATESRVVKEATNLNAHYEKENIVQSLSKNCTHLSNNKEKKNINLFNKYE